MRRFIKESGGNEGMGESSRVGRVVWVGLDVVSWCRRRSWRVAFVGIFMRVERWGRWRCKQSEVEEKHEEVEPERSDIQTCMQVGPVAAKEKGREQQ